MRMRNPWVFFRRRLFGWNVRLVMSRFLEEHAGEFRTDEGRTNWFGRP